MSISRLTADCRCIKL